MDILQLSKKYKKSLADLLMEYWKSRGMDYHKKWTNDYITKGHGYEILEDKFFIAIEEKEVVGSMSVIIWEGDRAEMRDFYVKPGYRKRGIGELLYQEVEEYCKNAGVSKIFAFILKDVLDFFKKHDFQQEGILKEHAKSGEDLIAIGKFF